MNEQRPIACDLTAISENERETHEKSSEKVFNAMKQFRELPDGYGFLLPADTDIIEQAGLFIARERLCCPFFNFSLEVTPDQGPVWLNLRGSGETKQFIEQTILAHPNRQKKL